MKYSNIKAGSFLSNDKNAMENGSTYRITGRKKEFAAHYMQGDFVRFVSQADMQEGLDFQRSKKDALRILPTCFK